MQFINPDININFIGKRKLAFILSIVMIIISVGSLVVHGGPKLGIDFQGGTLIQVKFLAPVKIDDINTGLNSVGVGKSTVQQFGELPDNEYLIRTDSSVMTTEGFTTDVKNTLEAETGGEAEIRRVEMVGPQVGQDLRDPVVVVADRLGQNGAPVVDRARRIDLKGHLVLQNAQHQLADLP